MLPSIVHKQSLQDCNSFRNFFSFFFFWKNLDQKTCSKKKNPKQKPNKQMKIIFHLVASSDTDFLRLCKTTTVMFDSRFQWIALVETVQPLRWLVGFGIRLQRQQCCSNCVTSPRDLMTYSTPTDSNKNTSGTSLIYLSEHLWLLFIQAWILFFLSPHISAVIDWRAVHLLPPCTVKAYVLV